MSNNYNNVSNYTYSNEVVSKLTAHIGNIYNAYIQHTGELWFHDAYAHMGQDLTYYLMEKYPTIREILPYGSSISFLILPDGKLAYNICMLENYSYSTIDQIIEAMQNAGFLSLSPSLRDFLAINGVPYMIKPGDTIWGICDKYGLTYEELLKLNPWLADRFSKDGKNALIKPDEIIKLPKDAIISGNEGFNPPSVNPEDKPNYPKPGHDGENNSNTGDPILIDLDGDGIKTTTLENGVYFDHQGDGFAENSAWVDENDGILAIDKNGDGIINDGNEIFGDNYVKEDGSLAKSGFDALRDLDSNNDGIISADDEAFSQIKILKGDGTVFSLEEAGIVSINLNSNGVGSVDENGNTLVSLGSFVRNNGSVGSLGDFNLAA